MHRPCQRHRHDRRMIPNVEQLMKKEADRPNSCVQGVYRLFIRRCSQLTKAAVQRQRTE
jgi:hypothetical protein